MLKHNREKTVQKKKKKKKNNKTNDESRDKNKRRNVNEGEQRDTITKRRTAAVAMTARVLSLKDAFVNCFFLLFFSLIH